MGDYCDIKIILGKGIGPFEKIKQFHKNSRQSIAYTFRKKYMKKLLLSLSCLTNWNITHCWLQGKEMFG